MLSSMAKDKMNILMVSETKLNSSFPETPLELREMPLHLDMKENLMVEAFFFL